MTAAHRAVIVPSRFTPRLPVAENAFARALATRRAQDGLTVRDAAKAAGVNYNALQRIETTGKLPSVPNFVAVARWLGLSLDAAADLLLTKRAVPVLERRGRRRRRRGH